MEALVPGEAEAEAEAEGKEVLMVGDLILQSLSVYDIRYYSQWLLKAQELPLDSYLLEPQEDLLSLL